MIYNLALAWLAKIGVLFLDRKDPKGWHVANKQPASRH